jgi:pyruvate ferredoxin oxidoreductase beta subunit
MISLKESCKKEDLLAGGHRACAGCAMTVIVRQVLLAAKDPVVVGCATGCLEVTTTIFPYTAWKTPFVHNAFENAAATVSGLESAYRALKKKGKIKKDIKFIAFGGDGGTYDIGIQALSGALERGHNLLYVCYDNQAYMNTGVQRSGSTPRGAYTSTTPKGDVCMGKPQSRKDLTGIIAAHNIPYVAQASPSHWQDMMKKVEKALAVDGPAFINTVASCQNGWKFPAELGIEMCRLAVETCYWPLYEIEDGKYKLTHKPRVKRPIEDWIKPQGRFSHLFKPEGKQMLERLQQDVDEAWERLLVRCGETK